MEESIAEKNGVSPFFKHWLITLQMGTRARIGHGRGAQLQYIVGSMKLGPI
jgi:hypothetical protein